MYRTNSQSHLNGCLFKSGLLLVLTVVFVGAQAQRLRSVNLSGTVQQQEQRCGNDAYCNYLEATYGRRPSVKDFETWMANRLQKDAVKLQNITDYTVPVVFHIIHNGESVGTGNNISTDLIRAQVAQLNKDFNNGSGSPYNVSSRTGMRFCLAERDPDGALLPQPGIERIHRITLGLSSGGPYAISQVESIIKPQSIWDPNHYLNIWLVNLGDGILGYASFPVASTLQGLDVPPEETSSTAGVVVLGRTVGSVATPSGICGGANPYINGRTLTHEMGHFFGLRHIWGDEACGNDYVDDTPVHFEENLGIPKHPKPNDCGTLDEMFENYMDYSDDQVLNTFTVGQVARIQTVMLNSPRRKELGAATTPKACFTANKLSFSPCAARDTTVERSISGTCPGIRTVYVMLAAEEAATGSATVNISVAGGTATQGLDFRLPQTAITFAAGDAYKMIPVEVIDDGVVENDETVILAYTIASGSGVTAGGIAQQFTLVIQDNDNLVINNRPVDIINTGFSTVPAGWNVLSSDGAKNKWLIGPNATGFNGNAAYISNDAATAPWFYETENAPSSSVLRTQLIDVKANNYKRLALSFRHRVFGEGLFQGDGPYDYGFLGIAPADVPDLFLQLPSTPLFYEQNAIQTYTYNFGDSLLGNNFYLGWVWENDDSWGDQPPWGIDDVTLQGFQTQVATATGQTRTITVAPGQTNHFTSSDKGDIIASIAASSGQVDCVQALVTESGNGQVNIATQSGVFKRSAKVIKVSPASGSSNANYTITLYFTEAELAVWGAGRSSLRVMKVADGVSLASVLTNANSVILTPVVSDLVGSSGYVSYTVTTTGFSQFFLVEPGTALPLRLIDFSARPRSADIELNWATAGEQYNRGFDVERSTDGIQFSPIAKVMGKNTSAVPMAFDYKLVDYKVQKGVKYYYRLLQTDLDGRQTYSPVRTAELQAGEFVSLYPNPASDRVRIQLEKSITGAVELFDARGARVKTWGRLAIPEGGTEVSVKGIATGTYLLKVSSAGKVYTARLQKE